jgi:hypothetical protein
MYKYGGRTMFLVDKHFRKWKLRHNNLPNTQDARNIVAKLESAVHHGSDIVSGFCAICLTELADYCQRYDSAVRERRDKRIRASKHGRRVTKSRLAKEDSNPHLKLMGKATKVSQAASVLEMIDSYQATEKHQCESPFQAVHSLDTIHFNTITMRTILWAHGFT